MVHRLQRMFGWLAVAGFVGIALVPMPALAATTWHVNVGAQTPDAGVQANGFFDNNITVDVGDKVTWTEAVGEIHTVTFLSGAPEPPLFFIIGNQLIPNGQAFGPAGGPTYAGSGFVNSGLFAVPGQTFSLTFTAPGTYSYLCLVHAGMTGTVKVNPAGTAYPASQSDYDRQVLPEQAQLLGQGRSLLGQGQAAAAQAGPTSVTVGIGELVPGVGSLAVLRFVPDQRLVHVGQTVSWTDLDPQTPHTVTFGTEPPGGPFGAYAPSSNVSGGHATLSSPTQSVNSGFIAEDPAFKVSNTFSATFTAPGTYSYFCALHDDLGMRGTIVVLP